jgi:hypothetical protein
VHALRRGGQKPTYGELIDALVLTARAAAIDPVSALVVDGAA